MVRYYYGAMGSGKSTLALQVHHNMSAVKIKTRLLTAPSRTASEIVSRIGIASSAEVIDATSDVAQWLTNAHSVDCIIVDEAHLLQVQQVDGFVRWADDHDRDVLAFGLLTDFRGRLFDASSRWLELVDEVMAIRTELRCRCGRPATHNARIVNGLRVFDGPTILIGDVVGDSKGSQAKNERIEYISLCRYHWRYGFDSEIEE